MNILINGFCGQMGQRLYALCKNYKDIKVTFGVDRASVIKNFACHCPCVALEENIFNCKDVDVVVDFSHKDSLKAVLDFCLQNKTPLVLATTGHTLLQKEKILQASKQIPIFYAPNMSQGVEVLDRATKMCANALHDFDIEIAEFHHNKKKDAPSGTANKLLNTILEVSPQKTAIVGRTTKEPERKSCDITIHSLRGGGVFGTHKVIFVSGSEMVELTHTALSRDAFADGAIKACLFLIKKKKGLFNMKNLV